MQLTGEVTTLEHEVGDHTVESRAGVAEALLASAESTEVGGGLGDNVIAAQSAGNPHCLWQCIGIGQMSSIRHTLPQSVPHLPSIASESLRNDEQQ